VVDKEIGHREGLAVGVGEGGGVLTESRGGPVASETKLPEADEDRH